MKKYASSRAHKGRTAYRTPSRFILHFLDKKKGLAPDSNGKSAGFIYKKYKEKTSASKRSQRSF